MGISVNLDSMPDRLKSRKLWLSVISALLVILNKKLNLGLSDQDITLMVTSLLSFVVVEGGADIMGRRNPGYKDAKLKRKKF